jgi:hypothetical protein
VVLLCVECIFTELLTEMRKPEVEKKAIIEKLTSELCCCNSYRQFSLKNFLATAADKCLRDLLSTETDCFVLTVENYRKAI